MALRFSRAALMKIHVFLMSPVQRCIAPGFFYELYRKVRII
jgi:hypothetical protein